MSGDGYTFLGTSAADVAAHEADTTNVHGITDTADLETTSGASGKVTAHNADTTDVHGIADTSALALTGHAHAGADVTSGTVAYARLPTGTAASTVAIGDHTHADSDAVTVGEIVPERRRITTNIASVSGSLFLSYFTSQRAETISTVTMWTGGTAAGATPTLVRFGIYSVAANGDLTLVASTANDTTLFATINTAYPKALQASLSKVAGQRYAVGHLIVTGAALPTLAGLQMLATVAQNTVVRLNPAITGRLTGQTDLPSPISAGSLVGYQAMYAYQLS